MTCEEHYPESLQSLELACRYGFTSLVKYFLRSSRQDYRLDLASGYGHVEVVQFILSLGIPFEFEHFFRPMEMAAENGFLETLQILVNYNDATAVFLNRIAIQNNWLSIIRFCVKRQGTVWESDLKFAIEKNKLEITKFLLSESGFNLPERLIKLAVDDNSVEIAEYLLRTTEYSTYHKNYHLQTAIWKRYLEMIKLLIDFGGSGDIKTVNWIDSERKILNQYIS